MNDPQRPATFSSQSIQSMLGVLGLTLLASTAVAQPSEEPLPQTHMRWAPELENDPKADFGKNPAPGLIGSWIPDGSDRWNVPLGCRPFELERKIRSFIHDSNSPASVIQNTMQEHTLRCEPYSQNSFGRSAISILDPDYGELMHLYAGAYYHYIKNPIVNAIKIKTKDGTKLRGLLAMKPGNRPLVIMTPGVQTGIDGSTIKLLLMHLVDESPYHVLLTGSVSNNDFIEDNLRISSAGFDEARYVLELSEFVRTQPFAELLASKNIDAQISDIHLAGASLGGITTFAAARMASEPENGFQISSAVGLCPVIETEKTSAHLMTNFLLKFTNGRKLRQALYDAKDLLKTKYPQTRHAIDSVYAAFEKRGAFVDGMINVDLGPKLMAQLSHLYAFEHTYSTLRQYRGRVKPYPAPFDHYQNQWNLLAEEGSGKQYFEANNGLNYYQDITIPMITWAAWNDMVVPIQKANEDGVLYKMNSAKMTHLNSDDRHAIKTVIQNTGNHCGFASVLPWGTLSTFIRTWVALQSHQWDQDQFVQTRLPRQSVKWYCEDKGAFCNESDLRARKGESYFRHSFKVENYRSPRIDLKLTWKKQSPACQITAQDEFSENDCLRVVHLSAPAQQLPMGPFGRSFPLQGDTHAQVHTRWLNANVDITTRLDQGTEFSGLIWRELKTHPRL